jgi:catechol 2,3-dioxygenase-like lactoylglutathione lyase family enzyme
MALQPSADTRVAGAARIWILAADGRPVPPARWVRKLPLTASAATGRPPEQLSSCFEKAPGPGAPGRGARWYRIRLSYGRGGRTLASLTLLAECQYYRAVAYLDHLVISVQDLDEAAARWQNVTGIRFARGGRHPEGTGNCIGVIRDQEAYLELITVVDRSSRDGWTVLVRDRVGPLSWAIGTDDLDRDVKRLAAHGVTVGEVANGSRRCPDGTAITWRWSVVGESATATWPFLIEWPTSGPTRLGVTAPSADVRLSAVTVRVPDPGRLAAALTGALGFSWCEGGPGRDSETLITDGEVIITLIPAGDGAPGPVSLRLRRNELTEQKARNPELLDGILVNVEAEQAPA